MIDLHNAIRLLNPSVISILGEVAYDKDGNIVEYNKSEAQAKAAELRINEKAVLESKVAAKASALDKLAALGLTADEITSLIQL
jgi:hypothetical protein